MTMNSVGIPSSSIVSSATVPSDGPVSSPVQSSGVFFRSLAGAPSSAEKSASQPKPRTQSPAPASNGTGPKGPTIATSSPVRTAGSGNLKKANNSTTTDDANGTDGPSADKTTSDQNAASVNSSSTTQTGAAAPASVTGSSPATDASANASAPPAGVVELLATASSSTKKKLGASDPIERADVVERLRDDGTRVSCRRPFAGR